jgi:hypothetical protein
MYSMKLKGLWGASMVLVALAASSCDEEQSAPQPEPTPATVRTTRQEANSSRKVLILGSTVNGGLSSMEALAVANLPGAGWSVEVATPEQWKRKTAYQFMEYRALVIGDAACVAGEAAFEAALLTKGSWSAIVDGNIIVMGSNPATNSWDPSSVDPIVQGAMEFATERPRLTGMYISLGCAYRNAPAGTEVSLLSEFGTFKVAGVGCAEAGHVPIQYPATFTQFLFDGLLTGQDGCAAKTVFTEYPDRDFSVASLAVDPDGSMPASQPYYDYDWAETFPGTPYILTRGATSAGFGCGGNPDNVPTGEECDFGDNLNGQPAYQLPPEPTCSWSCKSTWCGDGVVQAPEQCDMGGNNGRDLNGNLGTCNKLCRIIDLPPPLNDPPVAQCADRTEQAVYACGVVADINDGSFDPNPGDSITCVQTPAGPYNIGETTVTLTCTDSMSESDSCTAKVIVTDGVVPTIALKQPAPSQSVQCGDAYTDPGVTVDDMCSGTTGLTVTKTGSVPAGSPVGNYTLQYKVTDTAGNSPAPVTRTVAVSDTLKPVITLAGLPNMGVECRTPFVDPGATANDQCSGNLTNSIVKNGSVPPNSPVGVYPIRYNVTDPAGLAADERSRIVTVSDTTKPVVTMLGAANFPVECGTPFNDPGATANDACVGALPVGPSRSVNTSQRGSYQVYYRATDPSGNQGEAGPRTVNVQDTQAPTMALKGANPMPLECGTNFVDPGADATDLCQGTLTVLASGAVNKQVVGPYTRTYVAQDSSGYRVQLTRAVNVNDTQAPTVTITGSTAVSVECGNTYADPGATATDACAGALPTTANPVVNPRDPKVYNVRYTATDPSGNVGQSTGTRTVTVADTLAPTITLNGASAVGLECGTPFNDQGATANDACVGVLPVTTNGNVNHQQPGTYPLTYSATDGKHPVSTNRSVTVSDTLAPTVTMIGNSAVAVECGGTYADPGATASDACAGPLPAVPSRVVNPNQPNTYTINYRATDPSGNTGTAAGSRTVTVADTLEPTLTLTGNATMALECGTPFADPGATANDQCRGALPVTATGGVNHLEPNSYTLGYSATDGVFTKTASRTVNVSDTLVPTITVQGPPNQTFECGSTYVDPGATAADACDGDLTARILTSQSGNPNQPGTIKVSYSVTDDSGHVATAADARTVTVTDNQPPTLVLNGNPTFSLECGTAYNDEGAQAHDVCFGDISNRIQTAGAVNPSQPNTYTLTFSVTDPAGLSAPPVSRTVAVSDTLAPVVTVTGPLSQQLECGSGTYTDPGATASDACAGTLPAVPSTVVDPNSPRNYNITYSATDPSGNTGTSGTSRSVTVADTLPPTLALRPGPANLECGTPFADPGATANDQCRGDLSAAITRNGSVDHMNPGPYSVTYTVTDGSNPSISLTRPVTVEDTLAPAITVLGSPNQTYECGETYLDPGATASDVCDGDLTARIQTSQQGNPNQPGTIRVSYTVTDDSGRVATAANARTVTVNDNEPPVLVLNGNANMGLECGDAFTDPFATADDACFGDVTNRIIVSGAVNPAQPNTYTLTYNVTDPAGRSAPPVSRTVNVSDTVPPTISVLGDLNQTFECGGQYADPGATATDSCAGDVTSRIVRTGTVNGGAAGTYQLSYRVTDPSGNQTTAASSRTVSVTDTLPPTISLTGGAVQGVECGDPYADPGATANDACAGDLTSAIVKTGSVDPSETGSYALGYSVTDPSGLSASTSRQVNVSDTLAPTLALVGPASQLVECGGTYADPGAQATDKCEGDLTGAIVRSGSVDPDELGNYQVTYNVQDSAGHAAPQVSRSVKVEDHLAPSINVLGPTAQRHECGSTYTDPGATANDQCEGDLTARIVPTRNGNPNAPGSFTISYSVTDTSGNSVTSPVTRTVTVDDNLPPVLALVGPASLGLECGTNFTDPGATANDACHGDLTDDIVATGNVDKQKPAAYTVVYNVTDPSGQAATPVSRTVNVNDTLAPTIAMIGPGDVTYECGTTYQDPGATASDVCAGDLTNRVVSSSAPVPGQPGVVRITYSVTDPSGNTATTAQGRTVRVNDNEPPVVTLTGPASELKECGTPYVDRGATALDACTGQLPVVISGAVDHTTAGTYVLTYTATDAVGLSDSEQRSVRVNDTLGPVITLNGDDPLELECNLDVYEELGATASDLCSGAETVTASGTVDESDTGFYLITYSATDNSGNTTTKVRNVLVKDDLGPTMELIGANPIVLECALDTFNDPKAKATDLCEGDVSASVFREFTDLNINAEGNYIARYQGRDSVGHVARIERDLVVEDTTGPVLTVTAADETIECGTQPSLGVTATDACYGPVPVIANPSSIPNTPGPHVVTYTAVDPVGNESDANGSVTRTITVEDTIPPTLSIQDQDVYYECTGYAIGNVWDAPVGTATDICEGSIAVHQYNTGDDDEDGIPGSIDPDDFGPGPTTEVEGLYYVQYLAWDETYNIQGAILSVYVRDTIDPVLFLNPDNDGGDPAYEQVECFLPRPLPHPQDPNPYVNPGASAEDQCYGDLNQEVLTFGEVKKQLPGTYSLEYQVRDGAYNWATPVSRTVEVIDSLQPTVTDRNTSLTPGDGTMRTVELSQCAMADDICDGDVPVNLRGGVLDITSTGQPAPGDIVFEEGKSTFQLRAVAGRVYTVEFMVFDKSGNGTQSQCLIRVPAAGAFDYENGPVAPAKVMGDGTLAGR